MPTHAFKWTEELDSRLLALRKNGLSMDAIASEMGISFGTIQKRLKAHESAGGFAPLPKGSQHDSRVWQIVKTGGKTCVSDIADALDLSPKTVRAALESLRESGKAIQQTGDDLWVGAEKTGQESKAPDSLLCTDSYLGKPNIRFGLCSDNHLGSNYERLDVANALYDVYQAEGITNVFNCGNWIEGEARFNRQDIHVHGLGHQFKYFAKTYPQREGIATHIIGGDDHEGWYVQREGIDLGKTLAPYLAEQGRTDIRYLGYMEHDIIVPAESGETRIRLVHPGGGSAYALSYQPQKLIESLSGGEKPQVLCIGHYHKAEYLHYRNIHCWQAGCTQDQTPFMRKKRLSAHVGGWIIELWQAPDGSIRRARSEFMNFFDRAYHSGEWKYQSAA